MDDQIFNSSQFYIEEHYSKLIKKEFSIQDQLGVLVNNNSLQCCLVTSVKNKRNNRFPFLLLFMLLKDKQQQQLLFICFFILIIHIFTQCLIYKTGGLGTQTGSFSNESRQRKSDKHINNLHCLESIRAGCPNTACNHNTFLHYS